MYAGVVVYFEYILTQSPRFERVPIGDWRGSSPGVRDRGGGRGAGATKDFFFPLAPYQNGIEVEWRRSGEPFFFGLPEEKNGALSSLWLIYGVGGGRGALGHPRSLRAAVVVGGRGWRGVRGKGIVFPAVFCFALLGVANQSKLSLFYNSVLGGDLLSPAFQLVGEGVSIRFIPFTRSDVWEKNKGSTDQVGHILFNNITPGGDGRE